MKLLEITPETITENFGDISAFSKWVSDLPMKIYNSIPQIVGAVIIVIIGIFFSRICGKILVKIMQT